MEEKRKKKNSRKPASNAGRKIKFKNPHSRAVKKSINFLGKNPKGRSLIASKSLLG